MSNALKNWNSLNLTEPLVVVIDDFEPRAEEIVRLLESECLDVVAYRSEDEFLRDFDVTRGRRCGVVASGDSLDYEGAGILEKTDEAGITLPILFVEECTTEFGQTVDAGAFEDDFDEDVLVRRVFELLGEASTEW